MDETDLGLAKRLAVQRNGILYPGHPAIPSIPRGTHDEEWLQVVGQVNLVVITRDKRIRYAPVERQAWVRFRVRGFVLTGRGSQSTEDSLAILDKHWKQIESMSKHLPNGPWMYSVTRGGIREMPLL